jgi:hypothetical protein
MVVAARMVTSAERKARRNKGNKKKVGGTLAAGQAYLIQQFGEGGEIWHVRGNACQELKLREKKFEIKAAWEDSKNVVREDVRLGSWRDKDCLSLPYGI